MKFKAKQKPELCVSKDASRHHLNASHFDADRKWIAATDGTMLCIVPASGEGDDKSGCIASDAMKAARKLKFRNVDDASLMLGDASHAKDTSGATQPRTQANFPPVSAVVPDYSNKPTTITIGLNAYKLLKLAEALGTDGSVRITINITERTTKEAMIVHGLASHSAEGFGIIMPCITEHNAENPIGAFPLPVEKATEAKPKKKRSK